MCLCFLTTGAVTCIVQAKLLQTCQALEGRGVGPMSYVGGEETGKDQSANRLLSPVLHALQCLPNTCGLLEFRQHQVCQCFLQGRSCSVWFVRLLG